MAELENKVLISPATTPGSIRNENFFLLPYASKKAREKPLPWYGKFRPPYAILTASFLQVSNFKLLTNHFTSSRSNFAKLFRIGHIFIPATS